MTLFNLVIKSLRIFEMGKRGHLELSNQFPIVIRRKYKNTKMLFVTETVSLLRGLFILLTTDTLLP